MSAAPSGFSYQQRSYGRPGSPQSRTSSRHGPSNSQEIINIARQTARAHYLEIGSYLRSKTGISTRGNAKEKLARLTRQQFQELSTDVYDELLRRKQAEITTNTSQIQPFLEPQDNFHPKRNQARQKLATLPASRFTDLASDVYHELERRYPEFAEEDDLPELPNSDTSNYQYGQQQQQSGPLHRLGSGKRPMSPPSADSVLAKQPSLTRAGGAQATSAANEVLVPNKSMLVEEDVDPRSTSPPDAGNISGRGIQEGPDSPNGNQTYFSGRGSEGSSLAGGFIGRYINQQNGANDTNRGGPNLDRERQAWKIEKEQEIEKVRSDYEYQLTQLRNQLSDARRQAVDNVETANSRMEGRLRETDQDLREQRKRGEEQASQIRAYERDLAEMQERVNASDNLQAEVEELRAKIEMQAGSHDASDDIISELKAEVQGLLDELSSANQRLDAVSSERDMETDKVRTLESDLESWRTKYNQLQSRQQGSFSGRADSELYSQAIPEESLLYNSDGAFSEAHVRGFQSAIDVLLLAGRNQGASALLKATNDLVVAVGGLDDDVRAFEGRSNGLDASTADQLDTLKANCHATLSNLVTAARNHASASGLSPISLLDAAASHISVVVVEMTKQLGVRQSARYDGEREVEESATWPKQANYPSSAASFGSDQFSRQQSKASSSPQASTFAQRDAQANRSAYDQSSRSNILSSSRNGSTDPSTIARVNGRAPMLSSVNSSRSNGTSPHVGDGSNRMLQRTPSQPEDKPQPGYSSSAASYDNKVFDSPPGREPEEQDSAEQPDSQDGDYADFKHYLESQTEAIVHSIQSLLSAIRGGIQGQQLDDHLTEIVTIVSSIISMSQENMSPSLRQQGADVFRELSNNCDKLRNLQQTHDGAMFDRQTKQAVAAASFAIARSLKQLNLLFPGADDQEN